MKGEHFYVDEKTGVLVLHLGRDLGAFAGEDIANELQALLDHVKSLDAPRVVVDFRNRSYFGSALLEGLVQIWRAVRERHGKQAICHVSPGGRDILEMVRFDTIWPICDTLEDAIRVVREP